MVGATQTTGCQTPIVRRLFAAHQSYRAIACDNGAAGRTGKVSDTAIANIGAGNRRPFASAVFRVKNGRGIKWRIGSDGPAVCWAKKPNAMQRRQKQFLVFGPMLAAVVGS